MKHYCQNRITFLSGICHAALLPLVSSLFVSLLGRGEAAVIHARSASQADVQAAIGSASNGDTVTVPAGTATWSDQLRITKAVTLQGAGVGQTILQEDMPTDNPMLVFDTVLGKLYRLTEIEFRAGNRTRDFATGCVVFRGDTKTFRLDHCKFSNLHNRSLWVRNAACGVVDHNVMLSDHFVQLIHLNHDTWDGKTFGDGSWATPIDWGGTNAVYIEDNEFVSNPLRNYGLLDDDSGARFVFRYNTISNLVVSSHGTESTGRYRGVRQWEIYNNTFVANPPTAKNAIHLRGGTGVIFNNTFTGYGKVITLHSYRYQSASRTWGGSDGTSGWDLNDPKIYASGTAGAGSGIGPDGAGGTLVVPGAKWSMNQWVGYVVRDLDGLSNTQPATTKRAGHGPFYSSVVSNTSNTIIAAAGSQEPNKIFAPGDRFEIRKVIQGLDMIGSSTGDLLSGEAPTPRWLHQAIEPAYMWNNTKDGVANAGLARAQAPIKEGVHFLNNTPKPNYKPLVYPHPLVTKDTAATPPRP